MGQSLQLAGFDFVIIGLLLLFVARGLWVGFLSQVITLVSLLGGFLVAGQYHGKLFPFLKEVTANPHAVFWASYFIVFVITYIVAMLVGKGLGKVINLTIAGWFDKLLGGLLGAAKAVMVIALLNMLMSGILSPENKLGRDCYFCPYVQQVTEKFRAFIKDESVRTAFTRKLPAISEEKEPERSADGVRPFVPTKFPQKTPPPVK